jgi:hypothetical protein
MSEVPEEFKKVMNDFIRDLLITFPEYSPLIKKWWRTEEDYSHIEGDEERQKAFEESQSKSLKILFKFCKKKLPPRFLDMVYKNEEMFGETSDTDTEFLPHIHFRNLWQCNITEKTKDIIWKYLQLLLFSIVGALEGREDVFGETAKLFEALDSDDFKTKLTETLGDMKKFFDVDLSGNVNGSMSSADLPNPEEIHAHVQSMMNGKLGKLAMEIAEEATTNLGDDFSDATNVQDVFQKLIKNPTKLTSLIGKISNKLDDKIKSGEIKESELMEEATELFGKMKNVPGFGGLDSIMNNLGLGMGNLGKMNTGAMKNQLNQRMNMAKMKERMRAKVEAKHKIEPVLPTNSKLMEANLTDMEKFEQQIRQQKKKEEELLKLFENDVKGKPHTSTKNAKSLGKENNKKKR